MSEFLHNLSLQALTIDDDRIEMQFYEIIELNKNLKRLIRDDERDEIEIHENNSTEEIFEAEKNRSEILEEEIASNILNGKKIEYPNENFGSFHNTSKEIIEETNRNETIQRKNDEAQNQRDEEISSNIISDSRKKLIKSITDNVDILSQNELNNVSLVALPKVIEKQLVEEHVQETIKKNNQDYIKKSTVKLKITPPRRSSRIRSTNLLTEEKKKPYEKK